LTQIDRVSLCFVFSAKTIMDANIAIATDWDEFLKQLNDKKV
jgi:hypothetical protein